MLLGNTNTVVESMYYLLWIKDSGLQESKFPVRIPDTILINGRDITNWYFTGNNDQILKKKANSLKPQEVFDSLTKSNRKSGIVASIIQGQQQGEKLTKIQKKLQQSHLKSAGDGDKVIIRYLNEDDLYKFLFEDLIKQDLDESLILQKFIDPYGDSNNCIQAIWSPSTCFFTRCINNRYLNNTQYDPYERAVTFDGPQIFSKSVCLKGKQISGEIRRLCENIVKRIAHVTYERTMISRMTLYFKADHGNRLYFLYCTSLRLKDEIKNIDKKREINPQSFIFNNNPLLIDNNFKKPPNMKNSYTIFTTKPIRLVNDLVCLNCEDVYQTEDMMEIPFSYLMRDDETFDDNHKSALQIGSNTKLNQTSLPTAAILAQLAFQQNIELGRGNSKKKQLTEVIFTSNQIMSLINEKNPKVPFNFDKSKLYVDANDVPSHPLLTKLYPKMTKENFAQLKQKGQFDNLYIKLCHNCYYFYTKNSVITGAPLIAATNIKEIKKNSAPTHSTLFTPEMHKIALEKNYELSKEFNFVKYQRPEIYEQRLDLLYRDSKLMKNENNLISQKPKISANSHHQPMKDVSREHDKLITSNEQLSQDNQTNHSLQADQLLIQQNTPENRKNHNIFTKRPQTSKNLISSVLLQSSQKNAKRFDFILNLAQNNKHKQTNLITGSSSKSLRASQLFQNQTSRDNQTYKQNNICKGNLSNRDSVVNKDSLTNRDYYGLSTSKQTEETNDDSFQKNTDCVLQLYLKNGNQQQSQQLQTLEQQQHYLKNDYPQCIQRNELKKGNSSASTYRSICAISNVHKRDKFLPKTPFSSSNLTQKATPIKCQNNQGQTVHTEASISSEVFELGNRTSFQLNRPNTTQNASSHGLQTIKENNQYIGQHKNPYLPMAFSPLKQQKDELRGKQCLKQSEKKNKSKQNNMQNSIEEEKMNEQQVDRMQKCYTSHSKLHIITNLMNKPLNKCVSPPLNTQQIQQDSVSKSFSTNQNQNSHPKKEYQLAQRTHYYSNHNNLSTSRCKTERQMITTDASQSPSLSPKHKHNKIKFDGESQQNQYYLHKRNIQKFFVSQEEYQKQMENLIQDYNQQKD